MEQSLEVISLLKEYISTGSCSTCVLNDAQMKLALAIDRKKSINQSTLELDALYEAVLWLKCDILERV